MQLKKTLPSLFGTLIKLTLVLAATGAATAAFGLAKYEPEDGQTYYGYCASGYWSDEGMNETLDTIYGQISDKPFLLYSFFVHAKEKGRWNGWRWMADDGTGNPVHGSGKYLERVRDRGFVPVVAWTWMDWREHHKSPTLSGLLKGEYDWYLDEWINGLKEFGTPVFIRLSHEMDGGWYPYSEGYPGSEATAELYVRYWRYVVDRFRAAGVDNVAWVWCVSGARQGKRDWVDYYPGDEYVDWIAADIYSNRPGSDTLKELKQAIGTHKPIMVPEGGTEDLLTAYNWQYPGNAAWIEDFYGAIFNEMDDQVKAVCWFQWNKHSFLERDPEQVPVYRSFVEQDRFINQLQTPTENPDGASLQGGEQSPEVEVPESIQFSRIGEVKELAAVFSRFPGVTGCKWVIESGDPSGLTVSYNLNKARIEALKPGEYTVKVHGWNKISQHAWKKFQVTVPGEANGGYDPVSGGSGAPQISGPSSLDLTADKAAFEVPVTLEGFADSHGIKWSLLEGDPNGLLVSYTGTRGTLVPVKAGQYKVKVQAWDKDQFESIHIEVVVRSEGDSSVEPQLSHPSELNLVAGGQAKTVEALLSGLNDDFGGNWKIDAGDPSGLRIVDNLTSATISGIKPGDYTVKIQFWDADSYVSSYLTVYVESSASLASTVDPAISGPDWVQIPADGNRYQLETAVTGFTPKNAKWSVVSGLSGGLSLEGDGLTAYLEGHASGAYLIKVEAWNSDVYVSHHIQVLVGNP